MGWYEDSLFGPIADDIARVAPSGTAVLEVGCGSGALSLRLAAHHGLTVTGVDVDPDEIRRAREKAARAAGAGWAKPEFLVADVARMPFDDASFDLVVSTFSMHHWDDKVAGLADVCRVLRPGSRALIWDLRRGFSLFHLRTPDPLDGIDEAPLELRDVREWAWPFGFTFFRRLELARPLEAASTEPASVERG
jgi:ubiquinone/menaquinone biosynthesis C-methylase UbiE